LAKSSLRIAQGGKRTFTCRRRLSEEKEAIAFPILTK